MASNTRFLSVLPLLALCLCATNSASIGDVFYDIGNDQQRVDKYNSFVPENPEMKMKACELVEARGYACEDHEVETKDGFIITIHRIPVESKPTCTNKDRVLLLNHGFLGSATDFLINSPKQSLVKTGDQLHLGLCVCGHFCFTMYVTISTSNIPIPH